MYDLGPDLDSEVQPGTNILVSGPPMSGKRSLCLDILASGTQKGEGSIIVTTKDGADRVRHATTTGSSTPPPRSI